MVPGTPSEIARDLLRALQAAFGGRVEFYRVAGAVAAFRLSASGPDGALELRLPWSTDPNFRSLFLAELSILRKLQHPNIVGIVREGVVEERPYYLVRRPDPPLGERLWHGRRLAAADLISLLGDITAALAHCHQHGVVHAEVDPQHITLGHGHSELDGFARAASFQVLGYGAEEIVLGNPTYFSPELIAGQPLDARSDIYSLGITAYECLTGEPPFRGKNLLGRARLEQEVPTPKLDSAQDWQLYGVVKRMLARDPAERFVSAEALLSTVVAL